MFNRAESKVKEFKVTARLYLLLGTLAGMVVVVVVAEVVVVVVAVVVVVVVVVAAAG